MFNTLKKRFKNEKGLSLVELLAVIVILGIIAAIAIPAIGNIINNSRDKGQISDALSIISAGKIAHMDNACGEDGCNATELKSYVDGKTLPTNVVVKLDATTKEWIIENYGFSIKNTTKFGTFGNSEKESKLIAALEK